MPKRKKNPGKTKKTAQKAAKDAPLASAPTGSEQPKPLPATEAPQKSATTTRPLFIVNRKGSRRPVKMSDAMRKHGVDEDLLSEIYFGLIERLKKGKNDKMLLDCAKECGKLLEAYPVPRTSSAPDPVKILLDGPRPRRKKTVEECVDAAPVKREPADESAGESADDSAPHEE